MELIRCLIYGVSRFRGKTEEEKKKIAAAAVAVVGSYASERGKKINCRKVILERCACTAHKHALTNPPNVIQRKCFHLVFSFSPPSIFYYEQLYQKPDCSWTETNKAFQDCEGDKKKVWMFFFCFSDWKALKTSSRPASNATAWVLCWSWDKDVNIWERWKKKWPFSLLLAYGIFLLEMVVLNSGSP